MASLLFLALLVILVSVLFLHRTSARAVLPSNISLLFQATSSYILARYALSNFWDFSQLFSIGVYIKFIFSPVCSENVGCSDISFLTFSSNLKTFSFCFPGCVVHFYFHSGGSDRFKILLVKRNTLQFGVISENRFLILTVLVSLFAWLAVWLSLCLSFSPLTLPPSLSLSSPPLPPQHVRVRTHAHTRTHQNLRNTSEVYYERWNGGESEGGPLKWEIMRIIRIMCLRMWMPVRERENKSGDISELLLRLATELFVCLFVCLYMCLFYF